jgi:hypothetical protein
MGMYAVGSGGGGGGGGPGPSTAASDHARKKREAKVQGLGFRV